MSRAVRVHLLPALFEPAELAGGTAVVIDLLRATTTIIYALEAGADSVVPCGKIDEAQKLRSQLPAGSAVCGGERLGLKIAGFDCGNSPTEYAPAVIAGKTLVFTTTNGTRAILRTREARRIFIAALANAAAVANRLAVEAGPVHFVCAGTDGHVTLEDVLCAGTIVRELAKHSSDLDLTDDSTALAINLSETQGCDYDAALLMLRRSRGGRNLIEHGLDADIATAARRDVVDFVPELTRDPWRIRIAAPAS